MMRFLEWYTLTVTLNIFCVKKGYKYEIRAAIIPIDVLGASSKRLIQAFLRSALTCFMRN